jgi:cytoskeletal protein CcmA (bactofilin family)
MPPDFRTAPGQAAILQDSLSKDVEIKGKLKFATALLIDGKVEGEISSEGELTVGENADIRGEIRTQSVIVYGKVNGTIEVSGRCDLRSGAYFAGDVTAARLTIQDGATFLGRSEVAKKPA